jgi:ATP-binding cassette subfamily B protein
MEIPEAAAPAVFGALLLAGLSQVLFLIDPVIFGKIVARLCHNRGSRSQDELINGVLWWLGVAIAVAMLARIAKAFQEYTMRLAVQNSACRFSRWPEQRCGCRSGVEEQRSGETMAVLQKVRTDTERFINGFINILFASFVGIGFLIWYAVTKHWALIPVFSLGVWCWGASPVVEQRIKNHPALHQPRTNRMSASSPSRCEYELVRSLDVTLSEIRRLREYTFRIFELEMKKTKQVRTLSFLQGTSLNVLKQSILFILLWLIFRMCYPRAS